MQFFNLAKIKKMYKKKLRIETDKYYTDIV